MGMYARRMTFPPLFDLREFGLGAPRLDWKPSTIDRTAGAIDGKLLAAGNDDVPEAAHPVARRKGERVTSDEASLAQLTRHHRGMRGTGARSG